MFKTIIDAFKVKEIRKKMEQLLQEESSEMGPMGMTQQF